MHAPSRRAFAARSAAIAAAFAAAARAFPVVAQEAASIRLSLAEGDSATPALYAIKAGLFAKYGLNVTMIQAPSGAASVAALVGGTVDIAGSSLLPFLSAYSRGLPLQVVGPLAVSTVDPPYAALLVRKDAPFQTGRDLNGRTISSPALRDLNWIATVNWIDRNGGDSSTVKTIELPSSAIAAAIEEGRVDTATVTTPRYAQALNGGKVRVLGHSYEAIAKRFLFSVYIAHNEWAAKNPDLVARFGRALRDAGAYTNTHHAETLPIYAAFAKIEPAEIANAPRGVAAQYVDPAELQPLVDIALRYKVIAQAIDARTLLAPSILKPGS